MKNIAIFASGNGSNAENIINYFSQHKYIKIKLIVSNNPNAGVINRAKKYGIPSFVFNREEIKAGNILLDFLQKNEVDFIVLGGFLHLIPEKIIEAFPNRIINIHPALLPKYGGKGMHGKHVHEAVIDQKEVESGITIHYVNEQYDDGKIIFQAKCALATEDTPETLAQKVQLLEHKFYPKVIEELVLKKSPIM